MRKPRTDYGTIVLHWLLVASFCVAFVSGLRIAIEEPGHAWLAMFDPLLPSSQVWTAHIPAAVLLAAVAVAYVIYMLRSGLSRRIRLDAVRLRGLFGSGPVRWGALNVILYWTFFGALTLQIATGALLYFGWRADSTVASLHWSCTWIMLLYATLHVLVHTAFGGKQQLLRIFRPGPIVKPPPPLDPVELLSLLAEQTQQGPQNPNTRLAEIHGSRPNQPQWRPPGSRRDDRNPLKARPRSAGPRSVVQANPFVVATAAAITFATLVVAVDRESVDVLRVAKISPGDAPALDGDTADRAWRIAKPLTVMTAHGGNFDGAGETRIDIKAVHDGTWVYFLFAWDDPTRSLKQLPLIKAGDGWHLLHDGYENGDEHEYNEDKFSVLLTTMDVTLAGDRTFHAGAQPVADAPPTLSGRGLHYTTSEGVYADVWQWRATSGGPSGWMDDAHFGPPLPPTETQRRGIEPYKGGYEADPGRSNYSDNFNVDLTAHYRRNVLPRRLPKDPGHLINADAVDLDSNHGDGEAARWFLTADESLPYSTELDSRIPVGTIVPGVVLDGEFSGDRADIRCAARWAAGRWALEVVRRLDTHSKYDVPVRSGVFMRVAAFDHSQIRHTRHVRPIRLEVEK